MSNTNIKAISRGNFRVSIAKQTSIVALLAMSLSLTALGEGNTYRWLNERGEAVFSDRPPPAGTNYEVIGSSGTLRSVVQDSDTTIPGNMQAEQESKSKANSELCERARMNLIALEGAEVIQVRDDQGNLKEMSAGEKEIARQTAKAQIKIYCQQ